MTSRIKIDDNLTIWIKPSDSSKVISKSLGLSAFKPGDLINYTLEDRANEDGMYTGEVVSTLNNLLQVHYIHRMPQYNRKLWRFEEGETHYVNPKDVIRHVSHDAAKLNKTIVKKMWDTMGYVVGLHDFCLKQDEKDVTLDIAPGDSDDDDDEIPLGYIHPEMKDFIVPDNEGEAFTHPDMTKLTEDQKKWVNETHRAVRDWNNWHPEDEQQKAIKSFVDNMTTKYGTMEDERQFMTGTSVSMTLPPISSEKGVK